MERDGITNQLDRIEHKLDAHIDRHLNDAAEESRWRSSTEQRLTKLESTGKTRWSLIVSVAAVIVTGASEIFGLHLVPNLKP